MLAMARPFRFPTTSKIFPAPSLKFPRKRPIISLGGSRLWEPPAFSSSRTQRSNPLWHKKNCKVLFA